MLFPLELNDLIRRAHRRSLSAALLAGLALTALAPAAGARVETLRWTHPAQASIEGFRVYTRAVDGTYGGPVFDGLPTADAAGVFSYALSVPDEATVVVAITAYDAAGTESVASNSKQLDGLTASGDPAPDGGRTSYRINAGGSLLRDASGSDWESDLSYVTGGIAALDSSIPVQGSDTPELFHSNRYDADPATAMSYELPVPPGVYAVRLHTVETWRDMAVGQRVFDVAAEGSVVVEKYDIVAAAGAWARAHSREFEVSVTDGSLSLKFLSDVLYPTVAALEIDQLSPIEAPPADGGSGTDPGTDTGTDGGSTTGGTDSGGSEPGDTGGDGTSDGTGSGDGGATTGGEGEGDATPVPGETMGAPGQPVLVR